MECKLIKIWIVSTFVMACTILALSVLVYSQHKTIGEQQELIQGLEQQLGEIYD